MRGTAGGSGGSDTGTHRAGPGDHQGSSWPPPDQPVLLHPASRHHADHGRPSCDHRPRPTPPPPDDGGPGAHRHGDADHHPAARGSGCQPWRQRLRRVQRRRRGEQRRRFRGSVVASTPPVIRARLTTRGPGARFRRAVTASRVGRARRSTTSRTGRGPAPPTEEELVLGLEPRRRPHHGHAPAAVRRAGLPGGLLKLPRATLPGTVPGREIARRIAETCEAATCSRCRPGRSRQGGVDPCSPATSSWRSGSRPVWGAGWPASSCASTSARSSRDVAMLLLVVLAGTAAAGWWLPDPPMSAPGSSLVALPRRHPAAATCRTRSRPGSTTEVGLPRRARGGLRRRGRHRQGWSAWHLCAPPPPPEPSPCTRPGSPRRPGRALHRVIATFVGWQLLGRYLDLDRTSPASRPSWPPVWARVP